jgi:dienelactone hydrolase
VKKLLDIDPDRIGYMGMSHGGEMAFKIASEYHGVRAMVASEPAAHEFLRLKPDATARINPATGLLDVERMLMREPEKVRARIAEDVAKERISTIQTPIFVQGRNSDELQGIFRVCYDLLVELGKEAKWESYEHDQHGFVFVQRNDKGVYEPDAVQIKAVRDSIAFFDHYLKPQGESAKHAMESKAGEVPATVLLKDVVGEIDMLLNDEWTAYLNRRTGELFTVPGDMSLLEDGDDLELSDWEEDDLLKAREIAASSDWLALPTKFDIHEYAIMKRFCLDRDDDTQRAMLLDAIAGKGAFRMFKNLIRRYGIEQQWYAYRDSEIERFVADWLDEQGIPYKP